MVSLFVQTATQSGVKYAKGLCVTDINMGHREIEFRAWDKDEKKMLEVGMLGINFARSHRSEMQDGSWSVGTMDSGLGLMQYTGLKDKNGKEIYEGDVVKSVNDYIFEDEGVSAITWDTEYACWTLKDYVPLGEHTDVIVVGNIYENPELL